MTFFGVCAATICCFFAGCSSSDDESDESDDCWRLTGVLLGVGASFFACGFSSSDEESSDELDSSFGLVIGAYILFYKYY